MELNDTKAGMEGLDKEKINKVIRKASAGSKFYEREEEKKQALQERIKKLQAAKEKLSPAKLMEAQYKMDQMVIALEMERDLSRTIVHVDMDAFYAAVAMRDDPRLREKPIAVGSYKMLSTSNYIARRFGVRAAMPGFIGKQLCPNLKIVPSDFRKYREVSGQVREIFANYDPNFAMMSLDEGYLDITEYLANRTGDPTEHARKRYDGPCICRLPRVVPNEPVPSRVEPQETKESCLKCGKICVNVDDKVAFGNSADEVVAEMRFRIQQKTGLTASAGIAPNTMLAKICSDKNKPNGQFHLEANLNDVKEFVRTLPVRKVSGIGKVSEEQLKGLGIETCAELYEQRAVISLLFSETSAQHFLRISLGIGSTYLSHDREQKSISVERSFSEMSDRDKMRKLLDELCQSLADDVAKQEVVGRTVTLKLKTVDFKIRTRAQTLSKYINRAEEIFSAAMELLLGEIAKSPLRIRLMGVRLSGLSSADRKPGPTLDSFFKTADEEDELKNSDFDGPGICPVCNKRISTKDGDSDFNPHLDDCLSAKAVREILEKESMVDPSKTQKRKAETTRTESRKRAPAKQASLSNFLVQKKPS